MIPLKDGSDAEFAACRGALAEIGFDEPTLLERHGMRSLSQFGADRPAPPRDDALETATRLFLEGASIPRAEIESRFPAGALGAMQALGLVAPDAADARLLAATVLLHPRKGLLLACDRPPLREDPAAEQRTDIVYASMTEDAERFVGILPQGPCDEFLDLGTGNGVAALCAASGSARRAVGVDVTERAVRFAEFNRRLNGLANAEFLCGDLYGPVEGRTFDRIAIHPPYIPSLRRRLIYQDGGLDGQELLRRTVAGLPRHLRPGGRFFSLSLCVDREDEPFERQVRRWLGDSHSEFDVVFLERRDVEPGHLARGVAVRGGGGREDERALLDEFRRLGVRKFPYGDTIVVRHSAPRRPFTARRRRRDDTSPAAVEWLLACEARLASGPPDWLLDVAPAVSEHARLTVQHRREDGAFVPDAFALHAVHPFPLEIEANVWLANLVSSADGRTSGRTLFDRLRDQGAFGADATEADFAGLLARLVAAGVLVVPDLVPPGAAKTR